MRFPSKAVLFSACALLAGCAAPPLELTGFCSLNDPASEWVVGNRMARQAEQHCQGPYRILDRRDIAMASGHEFRWLIDCDTSASP